MTAADDLASAEAEYRSAVRRADSLREARNQMIRNALRNGWTHAKIADATGLTRSRVGQIALGGHPTLIEK